MSFKSLFEINLGNLDKFYQVKRAKVSMLQIHNWTEVKLSRKYPYDTDSNLKEHKAQHCLPNLLQNHKKFNRKKLHQSTKLHIQIKTDIKNTEMQALLKIRNILLYITSEKNTVFPTLDSANLIGTASKEDFSELSLWLLWRYTCTRSSLAQRRGRNMSLLKSHYTWTNMLSLIRLDFWQRESQTSLFPIST